MNENDIVYEDENHEGELSNLLLEITKHFEKKDILTKKEYGSIQEKVGVFFGYI